MLTDIVKIMVAGASVATLAGCGPNQPKQANQTETPAQTTKPNILLILADDMGYSDLNCYGSQIATPVLDSLAAVGNKFTRMYNAARCCPSRASLLTGLYNHQTGIGQMAGDNHQIPNMPAAYQGYLNNKCATLAELLKPAGYQTAMFGKWHLGDSAMAHPTNRGFDRYYGYLDGAGSYFGNPHWNRNNANRYYNNLERINPPDTNFYLTNALTDSAINFVANTNTQTPFFMYLAYTAPHWPVHAPEAVIQKYMDAFAVGWDSVANRRLAKQKTLGLVPKNLPLPPVCSPQIEPWVQIPDSQKNDWIRRMATYAAMIDIMDKNIGKLINTLRQTGQLSNTAILFLSDNGGCMEQVWQWDRITHPQTGPIGSPKSFNSVGYPWARVNNTPFRLFKSFTHEGGISTPFVATIPGHNNYKGTWLNKPVHIIDIVPTCLQLAQTKYPAQLKSQTLLPAQGTSLLPYLTDTANYKPATYGWEHNGNKAILHNGYKLVSYYGACGTENQGTWELYNTQTDRFEQNDLAAQMPNKVEELKIIYQKWADKVGVEPFEKIRKMRKQWKTQQNK